MISPIVVIDGTRLINARLQKNQEQRPSDDMDGFEDTREMDEAKEDDGER